MFPSLFLEKFPSPSHFSKCFLKFCLSRNFLSQPGHSWATLSRPRTLQVKRWAFNREYILPQCGQVSQFLSSCTLAIWCSNWVVELKVFEHFEHWNGRSLKVRKFQKLFFLPSIIPKNKHKHLPNFALRNSNGSFKKKVSTTFLPLKSPYFEVQNSEATKIWICWGRIR